MTRKILPYNPKLKVYAKNLRNNSTLSEVLLWRRLNKGQIMGYDFHRQKPIDNYIVDFYCPDLMLAIEIDGSSHGDKIEYDEKRQSKLEKLGVRFLRFSDREIKISAEGAVARVKEWIERNVT